METKGLLLWSFVSLVMGGVVPVCGTGADLETVQPANFPNINNDMKRVKSVDYLGQVSFPTGYIFKNTQVGGLSGITYDTENNVYYALSDDRSQINPARFYKLNINVGDGNLQDGDITFTQVKTLTDAAGNAFVAGSLDPEGIALVGRNKLYISSEGDTSVSPAIAPFVNMFGLGGKQHSTMVIPQKYRPEETGSFGIRNNLAFESLTVSPDEKYLYTATENSLLQDGPAAALDQETLCRILKLDLNTRKPVGEFVYIADAVAQAPEPADGFCTNGLVDLVTTDNNGSMLALERSYSVGPAGNTIKLYEVRTQGALDVRTRKSLAKDGKPMEIDPAVSKRLLLDFSTLGLTPDNLEGLTFGPTLPDGRRVLIVVSDNNFSTTQATQFIALAVNFETIPAALPSLETPYTLDDEDAEGVLRGDSDDPAIWVHPTKPAQSLVITAQKDGGLAVFNLKGKVLQVILPGAYSDIRYNNVDLVYNFNVNGEQVDLAVASDRENDTLAVFKIDPETRQLTDITSKNMPATIFGLDDGTHTAYGLATYTSPTTGKSYAFATQRAGHQVAQLELQDDGAGAVSAELVRLLALPIPTNDAEDSQSEGMVVDRELGVLYVGMEKEVGVLKFKAEPDGGNGFSVIHSVDADYLTPDIEGLTLYYGPNGTGYLLVSSQGDNTYAVFDRAGDNAYLGSFVVAGNGDIDQANESDGADVINVSLGADFPYGLLVVQDGANDPQNVVKDDDELENNSTNFKFVPWQNVAKAFPDQLIINTKAYNPRK